MNEGYNGLQILWNAQKRKSQELDRGNMQSNVFWQTRLVLQERLLHQKRKVMRLTPALMTRGKLRSSKLHASINCTRSGAGVVTN
jgi:hypothetical protein